MDFETARLIRWKPAETRRRAQDLQTKFTRPVWVTVWSVWHLFSLRATGVPRGTLSPS